MRALFIMVLMIAGIPEAAAQDLGTEEVLSGCRSSLSLYNAGDPFRRGVCAGEVAGIWDAAVIAGWVCAPDGVSTRQAVQVVVQFIDANPARMNERFSQLAVEALYAAWPCK